MSTVLLPRPQASEAGTPKRAPGGFRPDIEGLRAVAVVAVVLDHLFAWPSGGFIGVDIFFVISGFLITGLLVREHSRTGRISYSGFYRRRIRRILPVSTFVLGATVLAAFFILPTARFAKTAGEALWAALISANWHFAIEGTDYLNAQTAISPLQHYWSLAVEEQFYVVWPVLIIAVMAFSATKMFRAGRLANHGTTVLAVVAALVVAASLLWALNESVDSPAFAYFSTFSRAWELGVGALLAVAAPFVGRLPLAIRPALAWIGLAGIAASLFVITPDTIWPAPGALLPVLATALVIAAGIGRPQQSWVGVLTNPVSAYLGKISYSLYLWHFPVIILLAAVLPAGPVTVVLAVVLMLGLSVFSFHFLEDPVRRSDWLEPTKRAQNSSRRSFFERNGSPRILIGWMAAIIVVTIVFVSLAVFVNKPVPPPSMLSVSDQAANASLSVFDQRRVAIESALAMTAWPEVTPSFDTLDEETGAVDAWVVDNCLNIYKSDISRCVYGDPNAPKTAVILGDSTAISYLPALEVALFPQGYKIQVLTMFSCPAANVSLTSKTGQAAAICDDHHAWVYDEVNQLKPDMVFMSSLAGSVVKLASDAQGADALTEWGNATKTTIDSISASTNKVVVMTAPPAATNLADCKTVTSSPSACVFSPSSLYLQIEAAEKAGVEQTEKGEYIDVVPWMCSRNTCPSFIGNAPIYFDGIHLVQEASEQMGPLLAETLFPAETTAAPAAAPTS